MRRGAKVVGGVILLVALAVLVRIALEPEESPRPGVPADPKSVAGPELLDANRVGLDRLAEELAPRRVVLVGETHFVNETMRFLSGLVDRLDAAEVRLLLELPSDAQSEIDAYLESGDEAVLRKIFARGNALPYQAILRWARENRGRIRTVTAMDEPRWKVLAMRAALTDTRNQSMADAIFTQYQSAPGAKVVAFGGQMHMMLGGRYRYDVASREPTGARLLRMGVPRAELTSVMLSGEGRFPLHAVWGPPSALRMAGEAARLPFPYYLDDAVFGVQTAGELFDYFVHLGPLTAVSEGP